MSPEEGKRIPIATSVLRKKAEVFRATMAIMRHVHEDIKQSDVTDVTWVDSDINKYSLVIFVKFAEASKCDAVLRAGVAKRPVFTNDIPDFNNKLGDRKLYFRKKYPSQPAEYIQAPVKKAGGGVRKYAAKRMPTEE